MAKLALINREAKRRQTVAKFAARRAAILALINDSRRSDEDRQEAREKLQELPRNASHVRLRNRCRLTGRPRGVFRKFVFFLMIRRPPRSTLFPTRRSSD